MIEHIKNITVGAAAIVGGVIGWQLGEYLSPVFWVWTLVVLLLLTLSWGIGFLIRLYRGDA